MNHRSPRPARIARAVAVLLLAHYCAPSSAGENLPPAEARPAARSTSTSEQSPREASPSTNATTAPAIGSQIADVDSLRDIQGKRRTLHSFTGYRAVVLVFLGVDCPLANVLVPTVNRLSREYRERDVLFLAIYPHEHESLDMVASHAADRDIPCLVLKDLRQQLADAVGAVRTPQVCLLDGQFALRYRGRVNDQYGVNYRRPKATHEDLILALEDVLAERDVAAPETPVDGCLLDRAKAAEPRQFSYTRDIAPLVATHCQGCHRPDRPAPFSLTGADDVVRWSAMVREVVGERRMPPWQADKRHGQFLNDRRMNDADVATLVSWIDQGMPLGEESPLPPPAPLASSRWTISSQDAVIAGERVFDVAADGVMPYQHCDLDRAEVSRVLSEDRWIQEAEALPEAPEVVHHIMVFIVPPGMEGPPTSYDGVQVLTVWAPGDPVFRFPPGTALLAPRGSRLVAQIHFQPNGKPAQCGVELAMKFAPRRPNWQVAMQTHENRRFRVAPGDPHARAETMFLVEHPEQTRLIGLFPHLHLRGKSFSFIAKFPDGHKETLLSVPRYDFNWQTLYWFEHAVDLPIGSHVRAVAHWDNSRENLNNPDPTKEIRYGYQTDEEMMLGAMMFMFRPAGWRAEQGEAEEPSEIPQAALPTRGVAR